MEIYDVPQLSRMLRTSKPTVRSYIGRGKIAGRKIGGKWLVCDDALKAFLMGNTNRRRNTVTDSSVIVRKS